jgi:catechol 2,3-dioxygenase-like lactoylglutathione lyase family enzyme
VSTFSHVGHCVRDLEAARAFYIDVLGFEAVMDLEITGSPPATLLRLPEPLDLRTVYLRRDGFVLELMAFREPEPLADALVVRRR